MKINENMLKTALEMVEIPSVNSTEGERDIGEYLEKRLAQMPYFVRHPEYLIIQELENDSLHRRNVMALLRGEAPGCDRDKRRTILLHGHTDTVGVEDYGALADIACKPAELMEALRTMELEAEVKEDLESGDYLFGRGACDMKSGDAVFIGLMEELSQHPDKLKGNLLISLNPVEENLHTGIIQGLDMLIALKEKYGLEYELAINNDYICPLFPGDKLKTIYTGVVGKLLPCFYIQGHETHVGQCFEGFDASMVAAKLVANISMNTDLCDGYEGEFTLPPSVLKLKDLKSWYNVQTAHEAFAYFNYFVHNGSMEDIVAKLRAEAEKTLKQVGDHIEKQARIFARLSGQNMTVADFNTEFVTYQELKEKVVSSCQMTQEEVNRLEAHITSKSLEKGLDSREIPIEIIRALLARRNQKNPVIVLYFAAPYCPHNTLQKESEWIIDRIEKVSRRIEKTTGQQYRLMKFFPSLSDSSYLRIDDSQASIDLLRENFPAQSQLYPIPIEKIQRLNIPAINYGCYGKDAHKWTERVNLSYTFGVLPELLRETLRELEYISA